MPSFSKTGTKSASVEPSLRILVPVMSLVKEFGAEEFLARTAANYDDNIQFIHAKPSRKGESWFSFYEECRILVKCLNIDYVMPVCDRTATVAAALRVAFPHLKGPSFLSVYMTVDKALTRNHIIPAVYNVSYQALPTASLTNETIRTDALIGQLGLPVIAKPANGTNSAFICVLSKREDFQLLTNAEATGDVEGLMTPMHDLLAAFLDCRTYTDVLSPKMLFEEYVDRKDSGISICTFDALVADGKFLPWGIFDNIYWDKHPDSFLGLGAPSALPDATKANAWRCLQEVTERLATYGFDNDFIDAEVFIYPDGQVKVMEINGRMFCFCKYLYHNLTAGGNSPFKALANIAQGKKIAPPEWLPNRYGLIVYISTFGAGRADEHIDYDAVEKHREEYCIEVTSHKDTVVANPGLSGYPLAKLVLSGANFHECMAQMESLKHELIKQPKYSPWFESS